TFTYRANDGQTSSTPATVTLTIVPIGSGLYSDDFTRGTDPASISPWVTNSGNWTITGGALKATNNTLNYSFAYLTNVWTNFAVQAKVQFPAGAFGGGIGGRLTNATVGSHYAAWIYPENSPGGSNMLKLIKFQSWGNFSYLGTPFAVIGQANLSAV